jgi:hypothetical protein
MDEKEKERPDEKETLKFNMLNPQFGKTTTLPEDRRIERLVVLISLRERVAFDKLSAKERRSKSELIRIALEETYPDSFGAKAK